MRGLPPEKCETAGLPLFDHAKKVEKERQLEEQREITRNATGEDILDSSPKKIKEPITPASEEESEDNGDKYWTTQKDWRKSKRK